MIIHIARSATLRNQPTPVANQDGTDHSLTIGNIAVDRRTESSGLGGQQDAGSVSGPASVHYPSTRGRYTDMTDRSQESPDEGRGV